MGVNSPYSASSGRKLPNLSILWQHAIMMMIDDTGAWNHELECTTVQSFVCVMPYIIAGSGYSCNRCFKCYCVTLTLVVHIGIRPSALFQKVQNYHIQNRYVYIVFCFFCFICKRTTTITIISIILKLHYILVLYFIMINVYVLF